MNLWTVLTTGLPKLQPVRAGEVSKLSLPLISLLLMLMIVSSCGMPTNAYLYAPIRRTESFDLGIMKFDNSTENDSDIFLGYMLLYRFYLSSELPADRSDTDAWNDIGEAFFSTSVLNTYDKENERGYYSSSLNYSLFKVLEVPYGDRSDGFTVTLDFSFNKTEGDYLSSTFKLRRSFRREDEFNQLRWVEEIETERPLFSQSVPDYDLTDTDLPQNVSTLNNTELVCAVWTVAYGFDIYDTFQNVYSKPVYLGNFMFTIN
jgi:hypothetical protein